MNTEPLAPPPFTTKAEGLVTMVLVSGVDVKEVVAHSREHPGVELLGAVLGWQSFN